jgi:uncharacterized protein Usg
MLVSPTFRPDAAEFGLTTAEILYRLPDAPSLLQTYVWQRNDLFPQFPELMKFLHFWQAELEGPLHSVRVAHCRLVKATELSYRDGLYQLH